MGQIVGRDTFTGAAGTLATSSSGHTWTQIPGTTGVPDRTGGDLGNAAVGDGGYLAVATSGAEYDVDGTLITVGAAESLIILGRVDTVAVLTGYGVLWNGTQWVLNRYNTGTATSLGTNATLSPSGTARRVTLRIRNATKKVFVDDLEIISSTDNALAAQGRGGFAAGAGAATTSTIDNFSIEELDAAITTGTGISSRLGYANAAYACVWQVAAPAAGGLNYTLGASGSIAFSGTAALIKSKVLAASGTVAFTGTAALRRTKVLQPSGTIGFNGSATLLKTRVLGAGGQIVFSGTAPLTFVAGAGGLNYTLSAGGSVVFSGSAPLLKTRVLAAGGSVNFSGTASLLKTRVLGAGGSIQFVGTAPLIKTRVLGASGQIVFSGSAPLIFVPAGAPPTTDSRQRQLTGFGT